MFRSKKFFCYQPHDNIFNWPTIGNRASASNVSSQRSPKKKKEVQRLTFLCQNYDSVWLKRFLKRSGLKQRSGKQRLKTQGKQRILEDTIPKDSIVDSNTTKRVSLKVIKH